MANEVSKTIHNHAKQSGRLHIDQIFEMYEVQRQVTTSFDYIVTRQKNKDKVLLLSMDRVVTPACFISELVKLKGLTATTKKAPQTHKTRVQRLLKILSATLNLPIARSLKKRPQT